MQIEAPVSFQREGRAHLFEQDLMHDSKKYNKPPPLVSFLKTVRMNRWHLVGWAKCDPTVTCTNPLRLKMLACIIWRRRIYPWPCIKRTIVSHFLCCTIQIFWRWISYKIYIERALTAAQVERLSWLRMKNKRKPTLLCIMAERRFNSMVIIPFDGSWASSFIGCWRWR